MNRKGKILSGTIIFIVWALILGYAVDNCNAGASNREPVELVGHA